MIDPIFQEDDLIPIVKSGKESQVLDYKEPMNWDILSKNEKAEIIRDMMGFANSEVPGYIICLSIITAWTWHGWQEA